ncbi:pyridoxal phosphate-dependent aminotransferase [Nocardia sp. NPDC059177]|uniref:pyridoxal phosphate-dependent aminotransferase n=1 Tax=Nocardia sp. NPDC059177 TaxID=3346759 RepID=UPI0036A5053B
MFEDSFDPAMLRYHGDVEAHPGMLDFAVNVQGLAPPPWLRDRLAARLADLGRYPSAVDDQVARIAVAARHGRTPEEVLLLAGAAEGFALLPRLAPRLAAVVHPSFTEPELALREADIPVTRVILKPPYALDPALVPEDADLVVLGNPTNPTSVLHAADTIKALRRPGRILVVDEAFADAVIDPGTAARSDRQRQPVDPFDTEQASDQPTTRGGANPARGVLTLDDLSAEDLAVVAAFTDRMASPDRDGPVQVSTSRTELPFPFGGSPSAAEPESLAGLRAPDVLVLRSLTKTWALAGLRCGYVLGAPEVLARLRHGRPHWPLGTLQLEAISATAEPAAVAESRRHAHRIATDRVAMIERLRAIGIDVHTPASGPFLLIRVRDGELVRKRLADRGIAVRRADTFPGLGPDHLRVAVRGSAAVDQLVDALRAALW